jgi:hypothetical protein
MKHQMPTIRTLLDWTKKTHAIRMTLVAAVAIVLVLPGMMMSTPLLTAAHATPPTSGSGTSIDASLVITSTTFADGNTIYSGTVTWTNTGTLTGTFSGTFRTIFHADGTANGITQGTITGTVGGSASGTSVCTSPPTPEAPNTLSGFFVCAQGTGGLTGLHARITYPLEPSSNPILPYTVQYHFDP